MHPLFWIRCDGRCDWCRLSICVYSYSQSRGCAGPAVQSTTMRRKSVTSSTRTPGRWAKTAEGGHGKVKAKADCLSLADDTRSGVVSRKHIVRASLRAGLASPFTRPHSCLLACAARPATAVASPSQTPIFIPPWSLHPTAVPRPSYPIAC